MSGTLQTGTSTGTVAELSAEVGRLALRGSTQPLKPTGALDKYKSFEVTGHIGREYPEVQLTDILKSDAELRELAIIVSQRGVVFFRNQSIDIDQQQVLGDKLGKLSGRPEASGLHIHPTERQGEFPNEISTIDSARFWRYKKQPSGTRANFASQGWHSDITFEKVPSDFAILKVHTLPEAGGDTLWASAYEAYDRLSPAYQKFVEGLSAVHEANGFHLVAKAGGEEAFSGVRGHPANDGPDFEAIHPVIRTNPVTGWKGLFVNKVFTKRILGLTKEESERTLTYLTSLYAENHDIQARFRWEKDSVAIWSNTSTVHTATHDYFDAHRAGNRVVSIGEKPYFESSSVSRRADLGLPAFYQGE